MKNDFRDILNAWKELKPGDLKAKLAVLKVLGYDSTGMIDDTDQVTEKDWEKEDRLSKRQQPAIEDSRTKSWADVTPPESSPRDETALRIDAVKIREPRLPVPPPIRRPQGQTMLLSRERDMVPPELTPLFKSNLLRSIYMQLMATRSPEGDLDVRELVSLAAQRKPLDKVPRLTVSTMARGAQILIDRSNTMLPFRQDTQSVESLIADIFGTNSIRILHFANNPLRGTGTGLRRSWRPYQEAWLPVERTRVLVIADLGIGYDGGELPSYPAEWLEFARCVSRHDCPLTFLTPYGPHRWPPSLANRLKIIHWDPSTTASVVSRHT